MSEDECGICGGSGLLLDESCPLCQDVIGTQCQLPGEMNFMEIQKRAEPKGGLSWKPSLRVRGGEDCSVVHLLGSPLGLQKTEQSKKKI
eukprot:2269102-Karenia_brevis.AAC.1